MKKTVTNVTTMAKSKVNEMSVYESSIAATALLFFLGVGIPTWFAFGIHWGIGLGAMCAFWGGPGFGIMVAGARMSLLDEHRNLPQPVQLD